MRLCFICFVLLVYFATSTKTQVVVQQNLTPWKIQHLHQVGEEIVKREDRIAMYLEGIELTATIPAGANNKSLHYFIGEHAEFDITVSPCTGPLRGVHFHTIKTVKNSLNVSAYSNWLNRNKRSSDFLIALRRRYLFERPVELRAYEVEGDNRHMQCISTGPNWLKGSSTARVHMTFLKKSGDTLVMTLFGQPESSFKIRWTVKRHGTHYEPLEGYPILPISPHFDACRLSANGMNLLKVVWPRIANEDASTRYCVVVNDARSLPHHCSFQHLQKNASIASSANLIHHCTAEKHLELLLPGQLSTERLKAAGRQLFVNVYAINDTSNLSSSYQSRVVADILFCGQRPAKEILFALRPSTYFIHWSRDIIFDWPQNSRDISLFLVPCRRSSSREFLYELQVFQQKTFGMQDKDQPHKSIQIRNAPIVDLTPLSRTFDEIGGKIRIRLASLDDGSGDFLIKGDKAAKIFFLNRTESNPLPVRPSLSNGIKMARSDRSLQEVDNDNYPVEFHPICQLHKIEMRMAVSRVPQLYRIATLAVSNSKRVSISEIERLVNACEYSIDPLKRLLGSKNQTYYQLVFGGRNSTTLEVQLPFSYGYDSPRYYFVLVYASHVEDVTSSYRSLFFYRMVDACHHIEFGCYSTGCS